MKLTPVNGNIIVKKNSVTTKTVGGIYIPDFVNVDATLECTVLAVSDDFYDEKGVLRSIDLRPGDIVIIHSSFGIDIDKSHKIIREKDIVYVK